MSTAMEEQEAKGMSRKEVAAMLAAMESRIQTNLRGMMQVAGMDTQASGQQVAVAQNALVAKTPNTACWLPGDIRIMEAHWEMGEEDTILLVPKFGIYLPGVDIDAGKDESGFFNISGMPIRVDMSSSNISPTNDPGWFYLTHSSWISTFPFWPTGVIAHLYNNTEGTVPENLINSQWMPAGLEDLGVAVRFINEDYEKFFDYDSAYPAANQPPKKYLQFRTPLCKIFSQNGLVQKYGRQGMIEVQMLRRGRVNFIVPPNLNSEIWKTAGDADFQDSEHNFLPQRTVVTTWIAQDPDHFGIHQLGILNARVDPVAKATNDKIVGIRTVNGVPEATMLLPWETAGDADAAPLTEQNTIVTVKTDANGKPRLGLHNATQTAQTKATGDKIVAIRNVNNVPTATMLDPWNGAGNIGDTDAEDPTSMTIETIPETDPPELRIHNCDMPPDVIAEPTECGVVYVDTSGDVPETKLASVAPL